MAQIRVERDTLARMLRSHGEDDLADQAESLTDDELTRIGRLGAYYAWSEDALAQLGSMAGPERSRWPRSTYWRTPGAICDVITPNLSLRWEGSEEPDETERTRDRELRRHAADKQRPGAND